MKIVGCDLHTRYQQITMLDDGEDGLRIARETPPHVVLVDMILPKMQGRAGPALSRVSHHTNMGGWPSIVPH